MKGKVKVFNELKKMHPDARPDVFDATWNLIHNSEDESYVDFVKAFNAFFSRAFRTKDPKALRQFKKIREAGYSPDDDRLVFMAINQDIHHNETNFKYVTPEYTTRMDIYERFFNQAPIVSNSKKVGFSNSKNPFIQ